MDDPMSEPDNLVLTLLRELRNDMNAGFAGVNRRLDDHDKRFEALRQAINGESVLGRYAASEGDERLAAIEQRQ
jgi:hypothetical protein